jgi:hypothetical protein
MPPITPPINAPSIVDGDVSVNAMSPTVVVDTMACDVDVDVVETTTLKPVPSVDVVLMVLLLLVVCPTEVSELVSAGRPDDVGGFGVIRNGTHEQFFFPAQSCEITTV